jgi:hypothetical protein
MQRLIQSLCQRSRLFTKQLLMQGCAVALHFVAIFLKLPIVLACSPKCLLIMRKQLVKYKLIMHVFYVFFHKWASSKLTH